jgi:hypothetical protein
MSRVTIHLPDALEKQLRAAAREAGKSLSAYVAELVSGKKSRRSQWSREFLATFGSWEGSFEEPPELDGWSVVSLDAPSTSGT